jgi:hypothetical protein
MSKKIALGVASALLGITGVAGASVAVTSSANVDADEPNASVSFSGATPDLSAATDLLDNVPAVPGVADVLAQADGVKAMADSVVNSVAGQLPVGDLTGLLDAVPSACGALPFSLPVPAHTVGTALSFFDGIEGMIMDQLALVSSLAPSTPTVLSAPEILDMVKGELACAGGSGESALPFDVPAICAVDLGGPVGAAPEAVRDAVMMAIRDVAGMTNQNIAAVTEGVTVACSAAGLPVPVSVPGVSLNNAPALPNVSVTASPLPEVKVPQVSVNVPVIGEVTTPSIDLSAPAVPSITVGPVSTPAIPLPDLGIGGIINGLTGSLPLNTGGLLSSLLG